MDSLCIQLLGGFTVSVGDVILPKAQWKSRKASSLVKLLALVPGHRLHRDQAFEFCIKTRLISSIKELLDGLPPGGFDVPILK